ncbi:MAG: ABC transporter ATP-binding protein [Thermoprotei archaeon]|nr:MAG: ABC transporter ATP-binding protein [Thermoprotei archaeon]
MLRNRDVVIEFRGVWYRYPHSDDYALKDINLRIYRGEFVVVVGPSGCGKSTLVRCINGLIPHYYGGELRGQVIVCGLDTREVTVQEISRYVATVLQNPEDMLITDLVEDELAFTLENLGYSESEIKERIRWVAKLLDIEHLLRRSTLDLSYGEMQKVAFATALILKPKILLLDEFTSNLDPYSAQYFASIVDELRRKEGTTVINVCHRLEYFLKYCTRLIVMNSGRVVADGDPRTVLYDVLEDYNYPPLVFIFKNLRELVNLYGKPITVEEGRLVLEKFLKRISN